jgi:hypothetical protein
MILFSPQSTGVNDMTPTPKLRWAQRKYKLGPFYRDQNGMEAEGEYSVLQQWWAAPPININLSTGEIDSAGGEWRDVPHERE